MIIFNNVTIKASVFHVTFSGKSPSTPWKRLFVILTPGEKHARLTEKRYKNQPYYLAAG